MTPPATSSLLAIHRDGRLSRAHVERFATGLAERHAAGPGLGYSGHPGLLLRNAFLHEGQLILLPVRGNHEGPRDTGTAALSDVASAVRELELLGERTLANFFLAAWLEQSGAFEQLASLRAHLRRGAPPRPGSFIILHGPSGAGKTTLATALAGAIGALVVRNDVERIRTEWHRSAAADGAEPAPRLRDRLELLAGHVIRAGWPVIVDSCFLARADRERFRALAAALDAPFAILECAAPLSAIRERLHKRRAFGSLFHGTDAGVDTVAQTLAAQSDRTDALDEGERAHTITVDTGSPVDHGRLAALLLERTP